MTKRTTILFKVKNDVVATSIRDMDEFEITHLKEVIASEMECQIDEIWTEVIKADRELSDIDSTPTGLINWKDVYPEVITGVTVLLDTMDEYLDAMLQGTLIDYLTFSKK